MVGIEITKSTVSMESVKASLTPVLSQSRRVLKEPMAKTSPSGAQDKEVTG